VIRCPCDTFGEPFLRLQTTDTDELLQSPKDPWYSSLLISQVRVFMWPTRHVMNIAGCLSLRGRKWRRDCTKWSFIACTLHWILCEVEIEEYEMGDVCSTHGGVRGAYNVLVGKPEKKHPPGRLRSRWEDNMGMYLRVIGWQVADWIHVVQGRDQWRTVVNTVMSLRIPLEVGGFRGYLSDLASQEGLCCMELV
jgi:hypothetical protein